MAHGLPVYTCNPADFEGIDGLHVIPVRPSQPTDLKDDQNP